MGNRSVAKNKNRIFQSLNGWNVGKLFQIGTNHQSGLQQTTHSMFLNFHIRLNIICSVLSEEYSGIRQQILICSIFHAHCLPADD